MPQPDSVIIRREALEPFNVACGGRRTLVLNVRREDKASFETKTWHQPFVRIGRFVNNDLVLADKSVCFRHAYLQLIAGRWAVFDLRRMGGAERGSSRQPAWSWLDEAPQFKIGPYVLSCPDSPREPLSVDSVPAPQSLAPSISGYELQLLNSRIPSVQRINRPVTLLGSSRSCNVRLKDSSVSKIHASLVLTPRGLWILDLCGRNGVSVNRRLVQWQQLREDSIVQIGRFRLQVRIKSSDAPASFTVDQFGTESLTPCTSPSETFLGDPNREFLMGVVQHLTETRSQFFDYVQFQSKMITELVDQLRQVREAPASGELARIDELDRELRMVKLQLAELAAAKSALSSSVDLAAAIPLNLLTVAEDLCGAEAPPEIAPTTTNAAGMADQGVPWMPSDPAELMEASETPEPGAAEFPRTALQPAHSHESTMDVQARLSERMHALSRERNSRWQRLLQRLGMGSRDERRGG